MPYCVYDKDNKNYVGGQLWCVPDYFDASKHVCLTLDEFPEKSSKLSDDLNSVRDPDNKELKSYNDKQAKVRFDSLWNANNLIKAMGSALVDVSNGKKYKDIDDLKDELLKKFENLWL